MRSTLARVQFPLHLPYSFGDEKGVTRWTAVLCHRGQHAVGISQACQGLQCFQRILGVNAFDSFRPMLTVNQIFFLSFRLVLPDLLAKLCERADTTQVRQKISIEACECGYRAFRGPDPRKTSKNGGSLCTF